MEERQPRDTELRKALDRLVENELVFARGKPPEAGYVFNTPGCKMRPIRASSRVVGSTYTRGLLKLSRHDFPKLKQASLSFLPTITLRRLNTTRLSLIGSGLAQMLKSGDALEGPRAFAEKRAPRWKGR